MRSRIQAVVLPTEVGEFGEDLRRIFLELGRSSSADALTGECSPAVDVYETDNVVEIAVDLPGVAAEAVRIVIKGAAVLIAGEKPPRRGRSDSSFHLVERGFGRFARLIRVTASVDAARALATLSNGELRLTLPKIENRRGRAIHVTISSERPVT